VKDFFFLWWVGPWLHRTLLLPKWSPSLAVCLASLEYGMVGRGVAAYMYKDNYYYYFFCGLYKDNYDPWNTTAVRIWQCVQALSLHAYERWWCKVYGGSKQDICFLNPEYMLFLFSNLEQLATHHLYYSFHHSNWRHELNRVGSSPGAGTGRPLRWLSSWKKKKKIEGVSNFVHGGSSWVPHHCFLLAVAERAVDPRGGQSLQ